MAQANCIVCNQKCVPNLNGFCKTCDSKFAQSKQCASCNKQFDNPEFDVCPDCMPMFTKLKACACCAEPIDDSDFDICPECRNTIEARSPDAAYLDAPSAEVDAPHVVADAPHAEDDVPLVLNRRGQTITNKCERPNCTSKATHFGMCDDHFGQYINEKFFMLPHVNSPVAFVLSPLLPEAAAAAAPALPQRPLPQPVAVASPQRPVATGPPKRPPPQHPVAAAPAMLLRPKAVAAAPTQVQEVCGCGNMATPGKNLCLRCFQSYVRKLAIGKCMCGKPATRGKTMCPECFANYANYAQKKF